jgi:hypothetical protein
VKILKRLIWGVIGFMIMALFVFWLLPKGPKDLMEFEDPHRVPRKSVTSDRFMASTGTPWATRAALDKM